MKIEAPQKPKRKRSRRGQYTIRDVPVEIDSALRRKARENGTSLNSAALEALRKGLHLQPGKKRDLGFLVGSLEPGVIQALEECRQIDWESWK